MTNMPGFDQCVAHFLFLDFLSGIWFVCQCTATSTGRNGFHLLLLQPSPPPSLPPPTPPPTPAPPPSTAEPGLPAAEAVKVRDSGTASCTTASGCWECVWLSAPLHNLSACRRGEWPSTHRVAFIKVSLWKWGCDWLYCAKIVCCVSDLVVWCPDVLNVRLSGVQSVAVLTAWLSDVHIVFCADCMVVFGPGSFCELAVTVKLLGCLITIQILCSAHCLVVLCPDCLMC